MVYGTLKERVLVFLGFINQQTSHFVREPQSVRFTSKVTSSPLHVSSPNLWLSLSGLSLLTRLR